MKTSEVLNRAADLIEERGWTTGGGGWPGCHTYLAPESSPLCLEGGIMAALGWVANDEGNEPSLSDVDTCPAGIAVRSYLNFHGKYLFQWNDQDARTQAEVIEVLRSAALIEAAKESELAEVTA